MQSPLSATALNVSLCYGSSTPKVELNFIIVCIIHYSVAVVE